MPDTGSAYGGKHTGDAAVEAARLAKAAGKPVKVVWTREEEFTWAYFRPAGVIEVQSGARRRRHAHGLGVPQLQLRAGRHPHALRRAPTRQIEFHPVESPLRQGSYRALAATANHFAREIAHGRAGARDRDGPARVPAEEPDRRRGSGRSSRRRREKFGWGKRKAPAGRGFGIAGGIEKGGYVATCAEVEVDGPSRRVRVAPRWSRRSSAAPS